ncbi:MAG: hypothetical protein IPP48_12365 [Chitinophagaceae bacterium]|nr:hypothetical protein [Chitinophagaceae bacterium]
MLLGLAVLLGLISWGVWYFITKQNPVTSPTVTVPETTGNTAMQKDTAKKDTVSLNPVALAPKDSFTFKVVIKNYNDFATANKSYTKLTSYGHKLVLYTKDSVTYKVAMPFMKPLSDTGIVRDSLKKKLFGGNPYIEVN